MTQLRAGRMQRPAAMALVMAVSAMLLAWASQRPADADVTGITASAYGYQTNIGFNDGPPTVRGFGQTIPPGSAASSSPSVDCPASGSAGPVTTTDLDGAIGAYGPAVIFSGQWPETASAPPPSGPLTVTCQGTIGPTGSASSSADVINVGPGPFTADEVHSTCTATESGVQGTTTIVGGNLVTSTNSNGDPVTEEPVPAQPTINYTRTGTINDVGDSYRIVFNEQIEDAATGVLTVNAVHLYLLGPFAEGDMIIGSSTCGVSVTGSTTTTGDVTTTTGDVTTTTADVTTTTADVTTTTGDVTTTTAGGNVPTSKEQCRNGGFASFGFKNQGQCIAFVVHNGGV